MPLTVSGGRLVVHGDKLGTEQACCCGCSCACSSENPPFIDASCGLQAVILQFDLSQLGVCVGEATVEVTANDEDLFFPFSKRQQVTTAGGVIIIEANIFCEQSCVVVQFNILPGTADGTQCDFCEDFGSVGGSIQVTGVTDENGICCPVGGAYALGPNIPFCDNTDVQFSVNLTFVY